MFLAALTQYLYPRVTREYPYPPLTRPVVRGYGTRTGTGTGGLQSTRTRPVLCPRVGCGTAPHLREVILKGVRITKYSYFRSLGLVGMTQFGVRKAQASSRHMIGASSVDKPRRHYWLSSLQDI